MQCLHPGGLLEAGVVAVPAVEEAGNAEPEAAWEAITVLE